MFSCFMLVNLFALDGCNARENFAFNGFEQGATARGDVRNLIGQAELVDTSNGIAATDERECALFGCFCNGFCDCFRTACEIIELEYARRTVPQDGLRTLMASANALRVSGPASIPPNRREYYWKHKPSGWHRS